MRPSLPSDVWFVAQQVAYFKKITVMEVLVCILYNAALYYPPIFQIRNLVKKKINDDLSLQNEWCHKS